MPKINIPVKVPTTPFEADELNLMVQAINENAEDLTKPSHAFSSDHFIQDGVENVDGVAVPVIKLKLNPAHFEIVNGMISIKS